MQDLRIGAGRARQVDPDVRDVQIRDVRAEPDQVAAERKRRIDVSERIDRDRHRPEPSRDTEERDGAGGAEQQRRGHERAAMAKGERRQRSRQAPVDPASRDAGRAGGRAQRELQGGKERECHQPGDGEAERGPDPQLPDRPHPGHR